MLTTGLSEAAKERLMLSDAPRAVVHYSWVNLAAAGFDPDQPIHLATAALRMKTDIGTAKRRLQSAHRTIRSNSRFDGTKKIACEIAGMKLRNVAVAPYGATKAASDTVAYRAKQRHLGTITRHSVLPTGLEAISDDEIAKMAHVDYIDEDPRNVLRRAIEVRQAAGIR
jgi:hypothetical protein